MQPTVTRAVRSGARLLARRPAQLAAVVALASTLAACTPGVYTLDLFRELHYQPSQKLQEPNRLAPPEGAIPANPTVNPMRGSEPFMPALAGRMPPISFTDATNLQSPIAASPQTREQAQKLFTINCAVCHGPNADGQSAVATRFAAAGVVPPVDFRSDRVHSRTDGQLWWIVTNGIGNMPPFSDLLTDDQRWMLVQIIRNPPQGQ